MDPLSFGLGVFAGAAAAAILVGALLYRLGDLGLYQEDEPALARVAMDARTIGTGVVVGVPDVDYPGGIRVDRMDPRAFEVRLRKVDLAADQAGNH